MNLSSMRTCLSSVEPLEPRRLLSFTPFGTETTVTAGAEYPFDVAVAGNGSYIVAANVVSGDLNKVMVFRYSASGVPIGAPLTLYTYVLNPEPEREFGFRQDLSVAMDADGDAVVAYRVDDQESALFFNRISRNGMVSATTKVDAGRAFAPSVSMDDGGGFFLGWCVRGDAWLETVEARTYDAAGAPRAKQYRVLTAPLFGTVSEVEVVAKPDGSGAVFSASRDRTADGQPTMRFVDFGRLSPSGVIGPFGIIDTPDSESGAAVALLPDGSFVVGYARGTAQSTAHAQHISAAGEPVGEPIDLAPALDDIGMWSLALDAMPDGDIVASFVHQTGAADVTYAARYDATGEPVADGSGLVSLHTNPEPSHEFNLRSAIGADPGGRTLVAYIDVATESLRYRRFGSPAINDNGDLYVFGADAADQILVERVRENVFVNVNGLVQKFAAADVKYLSINGFGGDDDIDNNTGFPSTIHGGDGADTVWGGTGDDLLRGQGGNDFLRGGDGNDQVIGEGGDDSMHGGDGNDDLAGDAGEDTLDGAAGDDVLRGHRGSDTLYGEAGNDTLEGDDAGDYFEGGAGHDVLTGGNGADALFALRGNDRLFSAGDGIRDTVRGGVGTDTGEADDLDDVLGVENVA